MDDLISRETVIEICKSIVPNTNPDFYNLRSKAGYGSWMHSNGEVCAISNIEIEIEKLPAVDAVSVVRCKDCTYYDSEPGGDIMMCYNGLGWTEQNDFCSKGERREEMRNEQLTIDVDGCCAGEAEAVCADSAQPIVHSRWTTHRTMMHDGEWYCERCDYEPTVFEGTKYCPACGALMDLEGDGNGNDT